MPFVAFSFGTPMKLTITKDFTYWHSDGWLSRHCDGWAESEESDAQPKAKKAAKAAPENKQA